MAAEGEAIVVRLRRARDHAERIARDLVAIDGGIRSVRLFGSAARGDPHSADFDIDLAVEGTARIGELDAASVAPGFRVDLVALETLQPGVRANVEREGIILYGQA
jgi:predicted nucleotidyltransferase